MLDKDIYTEQINKVQDFIDKNLEIDLNVRDLSKVANFSRFHFQRIFSFVTGENLYAYIKRVRLEKAAFMLLSDKNRSIADIALCVGFSNQASFAKAFKERFSMSSSDYRKTKSEYQSSNLRIIRQDMAIDPINISIKDEEDIQVVYLRYFGPYKGDEVLFSRLFAQLYSWAEARNLINDLARWFVIYHDFGNETDENLLRLSVCLSVRGNVAVSGDIGLMTIPKQRYGVGTFAVDSSEYAKAWHHMYSKWLPTCGYKVEDTFAFEHYPSQSTQGDKQIVDIYIPIK